MKNYEILLIINPQFSDDEIPSFLEGVFGIIKRNNGIVADHKVLGRNKLAYPVKRAKFGVYVLAHVEIETSEMKKLSAELGMAPEILRFDVSNEVSKGDFTFKPFEKKDQSESEAPRMSREEKTHLSHKTSAGEIESAVENLDNKEPAVSEKIEGSLSAPAEEPEISVEDAEKKAKDDKVSLDELDKKLDEILKEEII